MAYSYILFFHVGWLLFRGHVVGVMLCLLWTFKYVVLDWCGCYCRKIVARPDNLAQVSQSRLGEMDRDSPKSFYANVRLGDQLNFWASERLAQARGVSPKRDPAWAPISFFEPSLRRRELAWARASCLSESLLPERDPSVWARSWTRQCDLCGCF